jgi:hypothetical protein
VLDRAFMMAIAFGILLAVWSVLSLLLTTIGTWGCGERNL